MGQIFLERFAPLARLLCRDATAQTGKDNTTLYKRVKELTNSELFIVRIANENSTADSASSLEEPTGIVKLP